MIPKHIHIYIYIEGDKVSIGIENPNIKGKRTRMLELAGMLKEGKGGNKSKLEKIMAKFAVQEGLRSIVVKNYLNQMIVAGLVEVSEGKSRWKYNPDAEWELFTVQI
jgi:hypothetical protein